MTVVMRMIGRADVMRARKTILYDVNYTANLLNQSACYLNVHDEDAL